MIVNLQPTKHDKKANLLINADVNEVMRQLMEKFQIKSEVKTEEKLPLYCLNSIHGRPQVPNSLKTYKWDKWIVTNCNKTEILDDLA